jgi:hypothetical protein
MGVKESAKRRGGEIMFFQRLGNSVDLRVHPAGTSAPSAR